MDIYDFPPIVSFSSSTFVVVVDAVVVGNVVVLCVKAAEIVQ